jgi:gamma-glutamyltranspeptidase/glutathione hydrolase
MTKFTNYKLLLLVILFCGFVSCKKQYTIDIPVINKELASENGMVVSAHPLASDIGVQILQDGGNAIDAAIATHFALAVCYPVAGNIGGGGFMVYKPHDGEVTTLDYREKAPQKSTSNMYLDTNGEVIDNASLLGHLAVGVPGSVAGMWEAHQKYGKLRWRELVMPSIKLAEYGIFLTEKEAARLFSEQENFKLANDFSNPFSLENWKNTNVLKQQDLGKTLREIANNGKDGFYTGWVADSLVNTMARNNGIITHDDLKNYDTKWRTPLSTDFKGYKIYSMPPPSSGGVALIQLLEMVETYGIDTLKWHSPEYIHLIVEAERRVYADRSKHLGDPDYYDVPVSQLIDSTYCAMRMADFDWKKASVSENIKAGVLVESDETTHLNVIDKDGNAVSITTTLNGAYGSKVVVKGAGFILNNEMDDFSVKPGFPNLYGLIGAEANKIEPGKRMLSSMTPTIITKDGKINTIVGTPGGSTIITSVFQNILNMLVYDKSPAESVASPRFHHQWLPDDIKMMKGIDQECIHALEEMGHKIIKVGGIGRVEAIQLKDNTYLGGADPDGDDSVSGY